MIYFLPNVIRGILQLGFAKIQANPDMLNDLMGDIDHGIQRLTDELSTYNINLKNFIEPVTTLNTWIGNNNIDIRIGYPRRHGETEQLTISYGADIDDEGLLSDFAGSEIIEEPADSGNYKQYYSSAQIENKSFYIHCLSENADIVWYVSETVKYILRTHRQYLEVLGGTAFKLRAEDVPPPETETGVHLFHRVVVFECKTNNKYTQIPWNIGDGDNTAPSEVYMTAEPKGHNEHGCSELGEEPPFP